LNDANLPEDVSLLVPSKKNFLIQLEKTEV
jgi:hypothetical protein